MVAYICIVLCLSQFQNAKLEDTKGLAVDEKGVLFWDGQGPIPFTLECPELVLSGKHYITKERPVHIITEDNVIQARFTPLVLGENKSIEVRVHIQCYPQEKVLRKWAEFKLQGKGLLRVEEIILEKLEAAALLEAIAGGEPQSYPVFIPNYYLGIEFPIASTRKVNDEVIIGHKPGLELQPGKWYASRKLVCGKGAKGNEKKAFLQYISDHRPDPQGFHVNYNSWWTSSVPYTKNEILSIMDQFQKNLFEPYGISFDTFAIDMGWSAKNKVWEIDKKTFPNGFSEIQAKIGRMGGHLGLWISPSNFYSPSSFDNNIAEKTGYETMEIGGERKVKLCCLGGEKYSTKFCESLVNMVKDYGIRHIKFDGYYLSCPAENHGHPPGDLSSEAIAWGGIRTWQALRKAAPDIWFETTCFGNPSPWWLFYVNSVIGNHGDDAPYGRVACPVYRESYTTARDYYSLQGTARYVVPQNAQEVLGIIHQTADPFLNDGVTTIMRGHMFVPLYVNPKFMNGLRWRQMSDLIRWTQTNAEVLKNTYVLLPESWQGGNLSRLSDKDVIPKEVYGYAHAGSDKLLVHLRNPWIAVQEYVLTLDETIGFEKQMQHFNAIGIYPQERIYGQNLCYGQSLVLKLAPYEAIVLELSSEPVGHFPKAKEVIDNSLVTHIVEQRIKPIQSAEMKMPDNTNKNLTDEESNSAVQITIQADIEVAKDEGQLIVLLESQKNIELPEYYLTVNCKPGVFTIIDNDKAWAATVLPQSQKWKFLCADLGKGKNRINLELIYANHEYKVSIWSLAKQDYATFRKDEHANALPYPERIYFDSDQIIKTGRSGRKR